MDNDARKRKIRRRRKKAVKVFSRSNESTKGLAGHSHGNPNKAFYLDRYNVLYLLGKGGYGQVISARDTKFREMVAIKVIRKKEKRVDMLVNEAKVNKVLQEHPYPYLILVQRTFQTNGHICMVMPLMDNGNLMQHIRIRNFSEPRACYYTACMLLAINHLHKCNIVHRDVKPHNMIMDRKGNIKLSDFGLSEQKMTYMTPLSDKLGTGNFKAPEYFKKGPIFRMVDFWALGISLHLMLTGKYPYQLIESIWKDKTMSLETRSFMRQMLKTEPEKRLGYGENGPKHIMDHSFFKLINWDDLENERIQPPRITFSPPPNKSPLKVMKSLKSYKEFIEINYDQSSL